MLIETTCNGSTPFIPTAATNLQELIEIDESPSTCSSCEISSVEKDSTDRVGADSSTLCMLRASDSSLPEDIKQGFYAVSFDNEGFHAVPSANASSENIEKDSSAVYVLEASTSTIPENSITSCKLL